MPPSRISRYEIMDRIGEGGMGVLYLARDPALERTVAIKVLSVHNAELRERFAREARSAAALKHHNIVTVYDVGEEEGAPFIAMEYIDGETLGELIRRRPTLPLARKLELMLEICTGLGYAHRAGIIHRDIKPANIMVTTDGVVKILDFGLARLMADSISAGLTRAGVVLGTPHYMPPEQIEGRAVDQRSDIFSVGLVLWELLTYRKAYPGDSPHAVLHRILHYDPPPLAELLQAPDPELQRIVNRAIHKDPALRYQTLAGLADDLGRLRQRLIGSASDVTLRSDPPAPDGGPRLDSGPKTPVAKTPGSAGRPIPNLDSIARRRSVQIAAHLAAAQEHFDHGRFEATIEECEMAAVIDPHHPETLELLQRAHRAVEDHKIQTWLAEADARIAEGALSAAELLIEQSLQLRPDLPEAQDRSKRLGERRRELERIQERSRAIRAALERGRVSLAAGALESAVRSAAEALAYEPTHEEALALREAAVAALEARRREQDAEVARRLEAEAREAEEAERRRVAEAREAEEAERRRLLEQSLEDAVKQIEAGNLTHAMRRVEAVLEIEADEARALQLRAVIQGRAAALRLEERQRRAADMAAARARQQFVAGDYEAAKQTLLEFEPAVLVAPVLAELAAEWEKAQRRPEPIAVEPTVAITAPSAEPQPEEPQPEEPEPEEPEPELELQSVHLDGMPVAIAAHEAPALDRPLPDLVEPDPVPRVETPAREPVRPQVHVTPPPPSSSRRTMIAAGVGLVLLIAGVTVWRTWRPADAGSTTTTSTANSTAPTPTTVPATPTPATTTTPPAVTSMQSVSINAVPWARVRISAAGQQAAVAEGTTPFLVELAAGEYTLEFRNPGFSPISRTFRVGDGTERSLTVTMPGVNVDRIVSTVLGNP